MSALPSAWEGEHPPVPSDAACWNNTSFSPVIPWLQLAWDSTSLGLLKECPQKYYLSIVLGWAPRQESVHLTFGLHYHAALEHYDHSRAQGMDHEEATIEATKYALEATWDRTFKRPWLSDNPNKNRYTLVRTVVWYLEHFKDDPLKTIILDNGKPAVELSFQMETDYSPMDHSTPFLLCGHLDKLANLGNGEIYVADKKTSKNQITQEYFQSYSPDNQMSTYSLASKIIYKQPVRGVIIDAAQVAVTFSRFTRGIVHRTEALLDEWYRELGMWLEQAQAYALRGHWPKNDKSCGNYGGCPFRGICSQSPAVRDQWLRTDYTKRTWDPMIARGEV